MQINYTIRASPKKLAKQQHNKRTKKSYPTERAYYINETKPIKTNN